MHLGDLTVTCFLSHALSFAHTFVHTYFDSHLLTLTDFHTCFTHSTYFACSPLLTALTFTHAFLTLPPSPTLLSLLLLTLPTLFPHLLPVLYFLDLRYFHPCLTYSTYFPSSSFFTYLTFSTQVNWIEEHLLPLPHFNVDTIKTKSVEAAGLCAWVLFMVRAFKEREAREARCGKVGEGVEGGGYQTSGFRD